MKAMSTFRKIFSIPSVEELALRELEEAKRSLLKAQSGREYADASCEYHLARIKRLTSYLQSVNKK